MSFQKKRSHIFLFIIPVIFFGCLSDYGRLRHSPEITQLFNAHEQLPNYRYYYNGRTSVPWAIIGIRHPYEQISRFWMPIDSDTGQFGLLVDNVPVPGEYAPQGALILDPDGEQIGVWFSIWSSTTVEMKGPNQVNVYSPYSPNRWQTYDP